MIMIKSILQQVSAGVMAVALGVTMSSSASADFLRFILELRFCCCWIRVQRPWRLPKQPRILRLFQFCPVYSLATRPMREYHPKSSNQRHGVAPRRGKAGPQGLVSVNKASQGYPNCLMACVAVYRWDRQSKNRSRRSSSWDLSSFWAWCPYCFWQL